MTFTSRDSLKKSPNSSNSWEGVDGLNDIANLPRTIMTKLSFSDVEFGAKRKQTRRDKFLAEMDSVIPSVMLVALVEPFYLKGKGGRPPYALETMLRIHFMQQWLALSDPSMEGKYSVMSFPP